MTHRYDGSSIDIEKQLVRYMVEHRLTRRTLLERIAKVGAVTALAPIVAACTGGGATASPSAASAPPPPTGSAAPPSEAAAPTPVPSPEDELFVYNWTEYIGEDVVPSFEEKYGVKVTYDFFSNTDEAYAKLGDDGGGYDVELPDLGRHPRLHRARRGRSSSTSRSSRTSRTSAPSGPIPATTRATRIRCRTCGGRPASATTPRRSRMR